MQLANANGQQRATTYGDDAAGTPIDALTHYTQCQHTETKPNNSGEITLTRCPHRAVMVPGYYRACSAHILHMLNKSLHEYTTREAAAHEDSDTLRTLIELSLTIERVQRLGADVQLPAPTPTPTKRTKKV